jgi:hypothetical protein
MIFWCQGCGDYPVLAYGEAMTRQAAPRKKREKAPARCKYCGAKLRYDHVGPHCPTRNCDWRYGLPVSEGGFAQRKREPK